MVENKLSRYLRDGLIIIVMMVAVYAVFAEGSLLPLIKRVITAMLSLDGNAGIP